MLAHDDPFSIELFDAVGQGCNRYGAATMGVPAADTVMVNTEHTVVIETLKRSRLYQIQTPQGFQKELFEAAHQKAHDNILGTDVPRWVFRAACTLVDGITSNIKWLRDIVVAKYLEVG